jgi:DNA-directed RNA polymerase specialized sigma24 family protein
MTPWFSGVVRNYVMRYRRRTFGRNTREGRPLESVPEPQSRDQLPAIETEELLDRLASRLPRRERSLLALIRRGYSLAEGCKILGIPKGSHAYYGHLLVAQGQRVLKRRRGFHARTADH